MIKKVTKITGELTSNCQGLILQGASSSEFDMLDLEDLCPIPEGIHGKFTVTVDVEVDMGKIEYELSTAEREHDSLMQRLVTLDDTIQLLEPDCQSGELLKDLIKMEDKAKAVSAKCKSVWKRITTLKGTLQTLSSTEIEFLHIS